MHIKRTVYLCAKISVPFKSQDARARVCVSCEYTFDAGFRKGAKIATQ